MAQVITSATPRPRSKRLRVALIGAWARDPLLPALRQGAARAARQMRGVEVRALAPSAGAPGPGAAGQQALLLQKALAQRPDGILIAPAASTASAAAPLRAGVDRAARAGVPVVTVGSDLPLSRRATYCGVDSTSVGAAAGREGVALLRRRGRLAILAGRRSDPGQQAMIQGVRQALAEAPEVRLAGVFYCEGDPQRAAGLMARAGREQKPGEKQELGQRPDGWVVLGNWPLLAGASLGAAVPRSAKVVALDPVPATWRWIQSGRVQVCLGHKPSTWGEEGLKLLVKAIDGQKLPPSVDVGLERVTPETLSEYKALWERTSAPTSAKPTTASSGKAAASRAPASPASSASKARATSPERPER